jgi:hypothetical protein
MQSKLLKIPALLLLFAVGLAFSCKPEEPKYPIDIASTEYSLEGTSCQWTNLPYDDKVIIIISNNELEQYLKGVYPTIDFSKKTLLLATGKTNNGISAIILKDLQQRSSDKYSLGVEIILNDTIYARNWLKALVIDKMSEGSIVNLNISLKETIIEYPINVPFENYSLEGSNCKWKRYPWGDLGNEIVIINSKEELEKYIDCSDQNNYTEIDFSKNTLLFVYGCFPTSHTLTNITLQQYSTCYYEMKIMLIQGVLQVVSPWYVPIIVRKIMDDIDINLIVDVY